MTAMSFIQRIRERAEAARSNTDTDPWEHTLRKAKGHVGPDGIERISTKDLFEILEVPLRARASKTVRLSRVMRGLGWSSIRARGLNPGGYLDRVRGYARQGPSPFIGAAARAGWAN